MQLWLSKNSDVPLREQLTAQIRLAILSHDLKPGQKLPSTRELARRFHIHSNTVSGPDSVHLPRRHRDHAVGLPKGGYCNVGINDRRRPGGAAHLNLQMLDARAPCNDAVLPQAICDQLDSSYGDWSTAKPDNDVLDVMFRFQPG